ncbi:hypothetical protein N9B82_06035 [Saprospiraceae bacterium]|nr:hypothetical protein [Saprospiraceae bacterium]
MYNNFTRTALSLLLLFVIGSFYNCEKDDGLVIVEGKIYNNIDGSPISDLEIKTELDRCGLSGFENCERVLEKKLSDAAGFFRLAFREDCEHELHVVIPKNIKDQFPMADIRIEDRFGDYLYTNCHDNLLLYKGLRYNLDVFIQPQILLTMKPVNVNSLELTKIEIPAFDISTNGLIQSGISKILDIDSYIGSFDILLTYSNGEIRTKHIKYDYLREHVINLDIEN